MTEWRPTGARNTNYDRRPKVGSLIPQAHAVWRVVAVEAVELNDDDRDHWESAGSPSLETWTQRPYQVRVEHVGGVAPKRITKSGTYVLVVRSGQIKFWPSYPNNRWPQCSCCGEPMPCTAELTDRVVDASMAKVAKMQSRMPGTCWGCGDPITNRQQALRYVGDNVDLPGGLQAVFHLKKSCHGYAVSYEERWLAADHSRKRILTYPKCSGGLFSHADGTHECWGEGRDPECIGGESHDHSYSAGCAHLPDGCPKGCPRGGSRCRPVHREQFRSPDLPQGQLPDPPAALDRRLVCPGDLLTHQDGTRDCIAGGRDDCWGGEQFRHETKRDCRSQTHGCPKCEVVSP